MVSPCVLMTMTEKDTLPNLIVIGGARSGTTSLHYYLSLHPEIFMSRVKELCFFLERGDQPDQLAWYKSQFKAGAKFRIRGETSPQYTHYPSFEGVPQRMHSLLPEAKLIYILRDPMERMLSHFFFMAPEQMLKEPLEKALVPVDSNAYVAASRQCWQLEQYLPYYPLSRILLLTTEDLRHRPTETLARIFRFLEVDDTFDTPEFTAELNAAAPARRARSLPGKLIKKVVDLGPGRMIPARFGLPIRNSLLKAFSTPLERPRMDPPLKQQLLEIFSEDVRRLRQLTGLRFDGWCV